MTKPLTLQQLRDTMQTLLPANRDRLETLDEGDLAESSTAVTLRTAVLQGEAWLRGFTVQAVAPIVQIPLPATRFTQDAEAMEDGRMPQDPARVHMTVALDTDTGAVNLGMGTVEMLVQDLDDELHIDVWQDREMGGDPDTMLSWPIVEVIEDSTNPYQPDLDE